MRYFIDTNIFIFLCSDELDDLDPGVADLLADVENTFIMSSESLREIGSLIKGGRMELQKLSSFASVKTYADYYNIKFRYVDESHMKTFYELVPAPNHHDPADLMIIAQAITENIPLISSDAQFPSYKKQGLDLIPIKRGRRARS